jgi:hypothetical protein
MTRVKPNQPLTLAEYKSLDSAGKKENLFIRVLDRLKVTEDTLKQAQAKILEANQKLETANAKAFAGNDELRTLHANWTGCEEHKSQIQSELTRIKSTWYFKLFGR